MVLVEEIVFVAVKDVLEEIDIVAEVVAVGVGSDDVVTTFEADVVCETEKEFETQPDPERVAVTLTLVEVETVEVSEGVPVTHAVLDGDMELVVVPVTVADTVDDCEGLDAVGTDDEDTVLVTEIEGEPDADPHVVGDAD